MTRKESVLVTGASGFIGAQVVDHLLHVGYAIKAACRSGKADVLRKSYTTPDFQVIVVDDLLKGDLSEALAGVTSVVHVASPLPNPNIDVVEIAVQATMNVLRQAYAARVYKIVVFSSIAAVIPNFPGGLFDSSVTLTPEDWNSMSSEEAHKDGMHPLATYGASKALAERAAWKFAESHPQIDLTTLLPSFVYGPLAPGHVIPPKAPGPSLSTNGWMYGLVSGPNGAYPPAGTPHCVDVRDVARATALSLTTPPAAPGNRKRVILCSGTFSWKEAVRHLGVSRPELKGRLLEGGTPAREVKPGALTLDVAAAKDVLGMAEFIPWKTSVEDAVDSILKRESEWVET